MQIKVKVNGKELVATKSLRAQIALERTYDIALKDFEDKFSTEFVVFYAWFDLVKQGEFEGDLESFIDAVEGDLEVVVDEDPKAEPVS